MMFYFTYGCSETQPFVGGWTEVEAPSRAVANQIFRAYHPDRTIGFLNCSSVYEEAQFQRTEMFKTGNFGKRCVERISLVRKVLI